MDKDSLLEKIEKLFALSRSSNPNEAALALRRAMMLMEKYHITEDELNNSKASDQISELCITIPAGMKNRQHLSLLLSIINKAFGVKSLLLTKNSRIDMISLFGRTPILKSCEYVLLTVVSKALEAFRDSEKTLFFKAVTDILTTQSNLRLIRKQAPVFSELIVQPYLNSFSYLQKVAAKDDYDDEKISICEDFNRKYQSYRKLKLDEKLIDSYLDKRRRDHRKYFLQGYLSSIYTEVEKYAEEDPLEEKINQFIECRYPFVKNYRTHSRSVTLSQYQACIAGQDKGSRMSLAKAISQEAHSPLEKLTYS